MLLIRVYLILFAFFLFSFEGSGQVVEKQIYKYLNISNPFRIWGVLNFNEISVKQNAAIDDIITISRSILIYFISKYNSKLNNIQEAEIDQNCYYTVHAYLYLQVLIILQIARY